MAVFTYTQTDALLGTLTNGRKIVQSVFTVTSAGTTATTVYPGGANLKGGTGVAATGGTLGGGLNHIIAWCPSWRSIVSGQVKFAASGKNGITVTPAATIDGLTFAILAVGV
jgi:hypothetical protein